MAFLQGTIWANKKTAVIRLFRIKLLYFSIINGRHANKFFKYFTEIARL